jgi:hypothetical protein
MTIINLRDVKDEPAIKDRARTTIETYEAKPDKRIGPSPSPISQRRHLDVDAVLARSLPRVAGEEL